MQTRTSDLRIQHSARTGCGHSTLLIHYSLITPDWGNRVWCVACVPGGAGDGVEREGSEAQDVYTPADGDVKCAYVRRLINNDRCGHGE